MPAPSRPDEAGISPGPANTPSGDGAFFGDEHRTAALAIEGSGIGIWDRDIPGGLVRFSANWAALLGCSQAEPGTRVEDCYACIHPDDLDNVLAAMQAHFDQRTEVYEEEHRMRCKDGGYRWVACRGRVVRRDSAGKPLRMVGTLTDITALRAMAEKLRQTLDLVTNLTNGVPGLVFQYRRAPDGASRFTYASNGIGDIYELTPEQVADSDALINGLIHPEDLPVYHASLDASAGSLAPWHLEYRVRLPRQGLRWRQGDARPQRLDDGSTVWHGFITDITKRKRIESELQEHATTDVLTQLPNRRHFLAQMEAELARIKRDHSGPAAVLMCDLDYFKSINDTWGHAAGDRALCHFAAVLRSHLRRTDIAGRMGGEEFAIVLRNAGLSEGRSFARRVQRQIEQAPLMDGGRLISLTVSIGIALMSADDTHINAPLSRSDMALYRAKENGRNRIECVQGDAS